MTSTVVGDRPPLAGLKDLKNGYGSITITFNAEDAQVLRQFCYDHGFEDARDAIRALVASTIHNNEKWAVATTDRRKNTLALRRALIARMTGKVSELIAELNDEIAVLDQEMEAF